MGWKVTIRNVVVVNRHAAWWYNWALGCRIWQPQTTSPACVGQRGNRTTRRTGRRARVGWGVAGVVVGAGVGGGWWNGKGNKWGGR